jgi:hypothetical protein
MKSKLNSDEQKSKQDPSLQKLTVTDDVTTHSAEINDGLKQNLGLFFGEENRSYCQHFITGQQVNTLKCDDVRILKQSIT